MATGGNQQNVALAALLIEDAIEGRDFPFRDDPNSLWWYRLYNNKVSSFLNYTAVVLLMVLAFFEDPVSCDPGMCRWPLWALYVWETAFLLEILFHLFVRFRFLGLQTFLKDAKNVISLVTIAITMIDMVVYAFFFPAVPLTGAYPQRFSRILRPIFIINATENRRIRRVVRCIRALIKDVTPIFVLFFIIVAVFSLIFFKIFQKQGLVYFDGRDTPYFVDYFDTFWDLFIYVTTSNSPDAMQPAYDKSYWYSFMFIIFLALTLWGVMPIILATTYNSYLRYLKEQIKISVHQKRLKLKRAFSLISTFDKDKNKKVITQAQWDAVSCLVLPDAEPAFRQLVFDILDTGCSKSLDLSEFLYLSDLLNIDIRRGQSTVHIIQKLLPRFYDSPTSKFVRHAVVHPFFTYAFDILIIANAVILAVCEKEIVSATEWVFLAFFTIEILLKLYTVGPLAFITKGWNIFDLLLVVLAWGAAIAEKASPGVNELEVFYDLVITVRVLRVFRIIYSIKQFVVIVNTFHHILPSVAAIVSLLLCVYYMFAILGMMVFAEVIRDDIHPPQAGWQWCGNKLIEGTAYASAHYCKNNFNSLANAFVLLFDLTAVNNWHLMAEAYTLATSRAARVYFIGFYFVVIYIILNIFVAFVLEAFLLQYRMFQGEQKESNLRLHVTRYLDHISGRKKIDEPQNQEPHGILSDIVATEEPEVQTHIEWTVSDGLPTISLWGPTAQAANVGFVMRNTYRNADTLLETMLFDEDEHDDQQKDGNSATSAERQADDRQRAASSVWIRSDLASHSIFASSSGHERPQKIFEQETL